MLLLCTVVSYYTTKAQKSLPSFLLDKNDQDESSEQQQQQTILADKLILPSQFNESAFLSKWNQIDLILDRYWSSDRSEAYSPEEDTSYQQKQETDKTHLTYGEVSNLGVRKLMIEMLFISSPDVINNSPIVFYDAGSGLGKLITQIYLDWSFFINMGISIQKIVGIEIMTIRHENAVRSWKRLLADEEVRTLPKDNQLPQDIVEFRNENILESDLSDATHLFLSSLCFPLDVMEELQFNILSKSPKIQVVAALTSLPILQKEGGFSLKKELEVSMTWGYAIIRFYVPPSLSSSEEQQNGIIMEEESEEL